MVRSTVAQPPHLMGRYAIYEKIASGGMATVHIGRLLGAVGFARTVAIKRMHAQFADDPEFVAMFLDEARVAARVRHPNVVPTLDVVADSGELCLVMEYVQGESLSRLVRATSNRGERIPPAMLTTIMVGVLHGLHAAHEATNDLGEPLGIVHRDVSPQNVLVGVDGVARVLDFGVAKAVGRTHTTRQGQLKGKLAYMAPEQVRGEVSRRTDVYAASAVLWEALTGQRLFAGDNELHTLDLVTKGCHVPPSRHAPGLPPALDAVTMQGLALDPNERFATARDMARALEEVMPTVAASKIGDWVENVAKQDLAARAARIATIESDSPVATLVSTSETISTQLSSGSDSNPTPPSPDPGRSVKLRVAAAAVGILVVVVAAFAAGARHRTPANAPLASSAPLALSRHEEPAPQPPPASSSAAVAMELDLPITHSASAAPPVPPPVTHPLERATRCNPPWTVDERGVHVFKKECLAP